MFDRRTMESWSRRSHSFESKLAISCNGVNKRLQILPKYSKYWSRSTVRRWNQRVRMDMEIILGWG
jgi:hypothetical protein